MGKVSLSVVAHKLKYMEILLIILIIMVVLLPLLRRWLQPFLMRYAQRKTEDFFRKQMGVPPVSKEERKARRKQEKARREGRFYEGRREYGFTPGGEEPIIPKEYAEDVEFVEIKEFTQEEIAADRKGKVRIETCRETQISDAEWEEIERK